MTAVGVMEFKNSKNSQSSLKTRNKVFYVKQNVWTLVKQTTQAIIIQNIIRFQTDGLNVLVYILLFANATSTGPRAAHMRKSRNGKGKCSVVVEESAGSESMNPFKCAEKKYRKYQNLQTDFRDVIDFDNLEANTVENRQRVRHITVHASTHGTVYCIEGHEGLFVLPRFLSESTQLAWARRCLEVLILFAVYSNLPACS
jgi:hypothetical protein